MQRRNKFWLVFLLFASYSVYAQAQESGWYVGPVLSHHNEVRSRSIYGPGLEERSSETTFWSLGLRAERIIHRRVGIHVGLNYTRRHYEMTVPFSHCSFLGPGGLCTSILAHVDRYGYKTVEVPLGVTGYLIHTAKFQAYLGLSGVAAVSVQSFYSPFLPALEFMTLDETHYFGTSLLGNLGIGYSPVPGLRIAVEPFLRVTHRQRLDPILITGYESPHSRFANRGVRLVAAYRLGGR